jgi:peptidyl-prolyl cis-trans isomerase D
MIQWFKDVIQDSWVFKAFMGVMILSFGIWGIGDVVTPSIAPNVVIQVGKYEVRDTELRVAYQNELERLRESLGAEAANEPALKKAVLDQAVNRLRQQAVTSEAAAELGLEVSKERIREDVIAQEAFKDESGKFSELILFQRLQQMQLTEAGLSRLIQNDLRQQMLLQPIALNTTAPNALVDQLFSHRGETRIADTLFVAADAMSIGTNPTDEQIKKTYDDNITTFTAPEYRKISVVMITSDDLVTPESIDESVVKAFYDENVTRYRTPELRTLSQLLFDTKEQAEAVRAMAAPGDTLAKLADKAKVAPPTDLGERRIDDPALAPFGEAAKVGLNEISQPVQTDFGWHLLQLTNLKPEVTTSYDQVKNDIRKQLAAEKATDALFDTSTKLEDEIAAGTPFEDIAKAIGGRYYKFEAIDRRGMTPDGIMEMNAVFEKVKQETFYNLAFTTPVGMETKLNEFEGGFYVLKVESSTPPTAKPMDKMRPEISALWLKQEKLRVAKSLADNMAADLQASPSLTMSKMADKDKRLSYAQVGPITRFGESLKREYVVDSKRVSPEMLEKLFKAKENEIVVATVQGGYVIARLKSIVPPKPEGDLAQARTQIEGQTRNAVAQDIMQQFMAALNERHPATLNTKTIDEIGGVAQP